MSQRLAAVVAMSLSVAAVIPFAAAKDAPGTAVLIPAADLKWADVPGFPGLKMAAVEGDPAKGPNHHLVKFPAGFSAPLHHHSSDHYVTILAGTVVLTVDGKETKLPAGSFFYFKGKKPHLTKCEAGAECTLSLDVRGKWDIVPEEKPAEKKK